MILFSVGVSYANFTYTVADSSGVDYIDSEIGNLERLVNRVDITKVSVELSNDQLKWVIEYNGTPLSNEEVFNGAGNGSYLYRIIIDIGVTVNGGDGHIWFNMMPTIQFNSTKNESEATTVYMEIVRGSERVAKSFGLYQVVGSKIVYLSRVPSNVTLK